MFVLGGLVGSSLYADDLCYEKPYTELSSSGIPPIPIVKDVLPIKALTNGLSNITIEYSIQGFNITTFKSGIGIDDYGKSKEADDPDIYKYKCNKYKTNSIGETMLDGGQCERKDSIYRADTKTVFEEANDLIYLKDFWRKGINYNLGSMNKNDIHKTWVENPVPKHFVDGIFSKTIFYTTYVKNGKTYHLNLNPCGAEIPDVSIADAFLPSPDKLTPMTFHVNLKGTLDKNVTLDNNSYVHYYTEDGTAKAGTDYIPTTGVLKIPQGSKSVDINVMIEPHAHLGKFYLILDNAYGARIEDGNATGTILYVSSVNKNSSKGWMGVGVDNSHNDVNKNTVDVNKSSSDNPKKQLYDRMNW
jgi:hypothetical protein